MQAARDRQSRFKSRLIGRVVRVDLRVQNIYRALTFYRDAMGLEVADRDGNDVTLRSVGGPVILKLDSSGVMSPADPLATGLFHTAFRFPDPIHSGRRAGPRGKGSAGARSW